MILLIERYKRTLVGLLIFFVLMIVALTLMEQGIEFSGVLFALAAISTILYFLFFWLFTRKKKTEAVQHYLQKEIWIASIIIGVLCLIGAIESYEPFVIFTIVFVELLLLLIIFLYGNSIKTKAQDNYRDKFVFPQWIYWLFFIGNGIILIVFEESFTDKEQFGVALLCYFLALFFLIISWFFKQIKSIINLKNEKAKTELMHLQSQVNPHFFFNMLNNLYGWVEKDSKKAQELILKLSDMMRYSIYDGQKNFVKLEEETQYLKNYIDLHKSRYHKKISISFNTEIEEASYQIMPLLLIILLENAFKHGVENLRENAYINIDLSAKNDEICFFVENNFDPEEERSSTGIGLKNLKRRLELVYPNKHTLSLSSKGNIHKAQLNINLT